MKCTIRTKAVVAVSLFALTLQMANAHAAVIFSDSFDRADNNDIDTVTTGITNNTGTSFAASAVYNSPWIDPNNLTGADTSATNGGGQRVKSNVLEKYNPGTVNMFIEHNFTNAEILAAGGFSVSLDVNSISQATNGQGAAVAIGMSRAEALTGHDAIDGGTTAGVSPIAKFTNAFQDTPFTTGTVLGDFYFAMRADKTVAWGVGGTQPSVAAPNKVTVAAKTGTISAAFAFTSFNAGSPVNYTVYYNGVAQGNGTFTWSGTNENYIGVDARDSTLVQMDNLNISTIPEPTTFGLIAMALACAGGLRRRTRSGASN